MTKFALPRLAQASQPLLRDRLDHLTRPTGLTSLALRSHLGGIYARREELDVALQWLQLAREAREKSGTLATSLAQKPAGRRRRNRRRAGVRGCLAWGLWGFASLLFTLAS